MTNIKTFPSWIVAELKQTCEFNDPQTWDVCVCVLIYLNKEYPVLYFSQVFIQPALWNSCAIYHVFVFPKLVSILEVNEKH